MKGIKNIRLKNYNYSNDGYYFVTIASNNRMKFSESELGLIENHIKDFSRIKDIDVDYYILMTDHVHMILILRGCELGLGEVIRRFKAKTSRLAERRLWQPNYYEHVIRNEKAFSKIREYIQNNPIFEKIDFEDFYR